MAKMNAFFDEEKSNCWLEMSDEEQEEIKIGKEEAEKGNYIDNEKIMNRFEKWQGACLKL